MKISSLIASGLGIGYLPKMPGTYASLATIIVLKVCCLARFNVLIAIISIITLVGWLALASLPATLTKTDPSWITIDEIAGQAITLLGFYPYYPTTWSAFLLSFLLFRCLDILKPFPISYLDQIKSLHGIMLDDIVAGVLAATILFFFRCF